MARFHSWGAGAAFLEGSFSDGWGTIFAASRKPELAEIQASVVPGELLDLAYSLKQKISFFRKIIGTLPMWTLLVCQNEAEEGSFCSYRSGGFPKPPTQG